MQSNKTIYPYTNTMNSKYIEKQYVIKKKAKTENANNYIIEQSRELQNYASVPLQISQQTIHTYKNLSNLASRRNVRYSLGKQITLKDNPNLRSNRVLVGNDMSSFSALWLLMTIIMTSLTVATQNEINNHVLVHVFNNIKFHKSKETLWKSE